MLLKFSLISFYKKYFTYLFLERGEGKEKERERNINVWLPLERPPTGVLACNPALPGNGNSDPLFCRLALNPLNHTSQGSH